MAETVISHFVLDGGIDVTLYTNRPVREALQDYLDSITRAIAKGQVPLIPLESESCKTPTKEPQSSR